VQENDLENDRQMLELLGLIELDDNNKKGDRS
jgi:hypothetical protein